MGSWNGEKRRIGLFYTKKKQNKNLGVNQAEEPLGNGDQIMGKDNREQQGIWCGHAMEAMMVVEAP